MSASFCMYIKFPCKTTISISLITHWLFQRPQHPPLLISMYVSIQQGCFQSPLSPHCSPPSLHNAPQTKISPLHASILNYSLIQQGCSPDQDLPSPCIHIKLLTDTAGLLPRPRSPLSTHSYCFTKHQLISRIAEIVGFTTKDVISVINTSIKRWSQIATPYSYN